MKISEVIQEVKDLSADPGKYFNDIKADTIITVPDEVGDDPAAQAAPLVQKGTTLPKDHPWNYLHGDTYEPPSSKPPGKAPRSKLTTI